MRDGPPTSGRALGPCRANPAVASASVKPRIPPASGVGAPTFVIAFDEVMVSALRRPWFVLHPIMKSSLM